MQTELIIGLGGAGVSLVALGVSIASGAKQSKFLYADAIIAARSGYILTREGLGKLISAKSLAEMIDMLKDTEYSGFIENIDKNHISSFNAALEKSNLVSIGEIKDISPKKSRALFDIYTKSWEARIIKTFFRSRFSNISVDAKLIEPIGIINPLLLEHLTNTKTLADMKLVLNNTPYGELFDKEYKKIEGFDIEIEKFVQKDIFEIIDKLKIPDKKFIKEIFTKKEDINNILSLLKLRIRGTDIKLQESMVNINNVDVKKLVETKDLKEFVEFFRNTEYMDAMDKGLIQFEKSGTYFGFEKELYGYYLNFVCANEIAHSIGPYPILSYITKKDIEKKNLLIIAKGIISNEEKEVIREMII